LMPALCNPAIRVARPLVEGWVLSPIGGGGTAGSTGAGLSAMAAIIICREAGALNLAGVL
jgi:hypothetical protein